MVGLHPVCDYALESKFIQYSHAWVFFASITKADKVSGTNPNALAAARSDPCFFESEIIRQRIIESRDTELLISRSPRFYLRVCRRDARQIAEGYAIKHAIIAECHAQCGAVGAGLVCLDMPLPLAGGVLKTLAAFDRLLALAADMLLARFAHAAVTPLWWFPVTPFAVTAVVVTHVMLTYRRLSL